VLLLGAFLAGQVLGALATGYPMLVVSRVITGCAEAAFFGVGLTVAIGHRAAQPGRPRGLGGAGRVDGEQRARAAAGHVPGGSTSPARRRTGGLAAPGRGPSGSPSTLLTINPPMHHRGRAAGQAGRHGVHRHGQPHAETRLGAAGITRDTTSIG